MIRPWYCINFSAQILPITYIYCFLFFDAININLLQIRCWHLLRTSQWTADVFVLHNLAYRSWLRQYAASRHFAVSIPNVAFEFFQAYYGSGVGPASDRNEYQKKIFLRYKARSVLKSGNIYADYLLCCTYYVCTTSENVSTKWMCLLHKRHLQQLQYCE
jgi:hypothetical protein